MQSVGTKGVYDMSKSTLMWCVATVSLCLAVLNGFSGRSFFLGGNPAILGPKTARILEGTSRLGACAMGHHN